MSNITSFVAAAGLTVLDSSADMSADARSCALTGVVTSELMLLSRHHFTVCVCEVSATNDPILEAWDNVRFNRGSFWKGLEV